MRLGQYSSGQQTRFKDLLSTTALTTVGFGDLSPVGPIRFIAGTEGLTGFLLIGWSASFTYLEMETLWRKRR